MSTDQLGTDVTGESDEARYSPGRALAEEDALAESGEKHNYAKVGSGRPSSLIYTYGPGAVMDLPQFTIMPACLDDWDPIWRRRDGWTPEIHAPRLRAAVRVRMKAHQVQLRPFPWQPKKSRLSSEGTDLGVPSRVFPQWLRCTGCELLAPLTAFGYTNTLRFRPDEARFEHKACRRSARGKQVDSPAVPARYLLACVDGHLDEFPYDAWVHRGGPCPDAELPRLKMREGTAGRGASAVIVCESCGQRRAMNEAQGEVGSLKLPGCRGRHPHLDDFEECGKATVLMLVGASNLWFAATESIIVMPDKVEDLDADLAERVRDALADSPEVDQDTPTPLLRAVLRNHDRLRGIDLAEISDERLAAAARAEPVPEKSPAQQQAEADAWDPVDLLVPEWLHLLRPVDGALVREELSGLVLSARERGPELRPQISRVLAVDRLRKVNALVGFTRIDDVDRAGNLGERLVPLHRRTTRPTWTVATEDYGEGVFVQLDEAAVAAWEEEVKKDPIWHDHKAAHDRNVENRFSETADRERQYARFKPPRYWLVHTFAHVLIREMALHCGYSAASLSERLYAWERFGDRQPAAGLLIVTTASDSDGTLGGLVRLSDPLLLESLVERALDRASRCSSDPVCARRTPKDPEDFLHGAACHCCAMASETSCERANRFLDRRFLLDLPGSSVGFFGSPHR